MEKTTYLTLCLKFKGRISKGLRNFTRKRARGGLFGGYSRGRGVRREAGRHACVEKSPDLEKEKKNPGGKKEKNVKMNVVGRGNVW